jgi:putative two-component system response regulator
MYMVTATDVYQGKILIVDDQETNILLLEKILRGAGYVSVNSTKDPGEVCDLHRENCYDLILLDLQMPGMDGYQVMEGLKEIEPNGYLPVLVITAQPSQKLRALKAGAKDFISKPFELSEVVARVHNLLEVRLLNKELKNSNDQLEQKVQERTTELQESYMETIYTLVRAAERKDDETGAHVKRISYY